MCLLNHSVASSRSNRTKPVVEKRLRVFAAVAALSAQTHPVPRVNMQVEADALTPLIQRYLLQAPGVL